MMKNTIWYLCIDGSFRYYISSMISENNQNFIKIKSHLIIVLLAILYHQRSQPNYTTQDLIREIKKRINSLFISSLCTDSQFSSYSLKSKRSLKSHVVLSGFKTGSLHYVMATRVYKKTKKNIVKGCYSENRELEKCYYKSVSHKPYSYTVTHTTVKFY